MPNPGKPLGNSRRGKGPIDGMKEEEISDVVTQEREKGPPSSEGQEEVAVPPDKEDSPRRGMKECW